MFNDCVAFEFSELIGEYNLSLLLLIILLTQAESLNELYKDQTSPNITQWLSDIKTIR